MIAESIRTGLLTLLIACTAWILLLVPLQVESKPFVVTTTPALGQIAEAIGGVDIHVHSLTLVGQDPHIFSPRPSHVRLLSKANLLFSAGFGLESGWLPALIGLSGNLNIRPGVAGYFNGGDAIESIGVARGMTSKSIDKWSPDRNPYWWLDPDLGVRAAKALAIRLGEIDPVNARRYQFRADEFSHAVAGKLPTWRNYMHLHTGAIITYNNTYVYFMKAMNIKLAGFIEPKTGIEPSTRHMSKLIDTISKKNVRLIWLAPYNNLATARRLADEAGIYLIVLPDAVEGTGLEGYIGMFDHIIESIAMLKQ